MVIQTPEHGFSVIRVMKNSEDVDIFLCRDIYKNSDEKFMILCLKNAELIYHVLPFFASQKSNISFDDFSECFSQNGKFHVVFKYEEHQKLEEKIAEGNLRVREKLEIARNLLEKISIQDMPYCIQYEVIKLENIMVDESHNSYFNYMLKEMMMYNLLSFGLFQNELAYTLKTLFKEEIAAIISEELNDFIKKLTVGEFDKYINIYAAFDKVYHQMSQLQSQNKFEPRNFLHRLWDRIKKMMKYFKPVCTGIVIIILFGFLIYSIINPPVNVYSQGGKYITNIGTLSIE